MPHRLGSWRSERGRGGILHLIPENDTMVHELDGCLCRPDIDFYQISEHEEVCIMTHKSKDHREERFARNE